MQINSQQVHNEVIPCKRELERLAAKHGLTLILKPVAYFKNLVYGIWTFVKSDRSGYNNKLTGMNCIGPYNYDLATGEMGARMNAEGQNIF